MTLDRDADLESLRTSCLSFISTGSVESAETLVPDADEPPPYSSIDQSQPWASQSHDSTPSITSLNPTDNSTNRDGRRKLLLIYIHGFMGNETSFQNFPADVHNLLVALLNHSHSVHTKIYPRYRSKKVIQASALAFSDWLAPHESPTTDVILLGHSLGGILAAEVALLTSQSPSSPQPLRHNLLGTLSFDTPFLGMHPGVIKSGLGSIFNPSPPPISQQQSLSGMETLGAIAGAANMLFSSPRQDSNYNPPFQNDVRLPVRSGWANAVHFVQKHSKDLRDLKQATQQLVRSHLEFGGCLADTDGLKKRYTQIRLLEEAAEGIRKSVVQGTRTPPRVRFVNYYTASTGRIKAVKVKLDEPSLTDIDNKDGFVVVHNEQGVSEEVLQYQDVILEEDDVTPRVSEDGSIYGDGLRNMEPVPEIDVWDDEEELNPTRPDLSTYDSRSSNSTLTPMPPIKFDVPGLPNRPSRPNLTSADKAANIRMQLEYARDLRNYQQALKTYTKTHCALIKDERKVSKAEAKLCPKSLVDRSKPVEGANGLDSINLGSRPLQSGTNGGAEHSIQDLESARQQELQSELEEQEHEVDACEDKITRALSKGDKRSVKMEKIIARSIDKTERKVEKDREKAERKVAKETEKSDRKMAKELEKSERKAAKDAERKLKRTTSSRAGESVSDLASVTSATSSTAAPRHDSQSEGSLKPKKDKKFCILPPKDSKGNRDPCWIRVYMQGVDEVGAHCGLFFPWQAGELGEGEDGSKGSSERYAGLVGGVCERIEEWVHEGATARAFQEESLGQS